MAAAAPSPLASSVEKTNGAKLSRLLIDGGTTVLRTVFDHYHPPANLLADVYKNYLTLNSLLRRRVLHRPQWDLLVPPSGARPDSNTFDITLLFILLTNICGLSPPPTGWHACPPPSDTSFGANLARIKLFRNELYGHVTTTGVDTPTFSALWLEISAVLVALGLNQAEIDRLKAERCGEEDYIDVVLEWADSEEDIKSELKDVRQSQTKVQQAVGEVHKTQLENHKILQDSYFKLGELLQVQAKTQQTVDEVRQTQLERHETLQGGKVKFQEVCESQTVTQQAVREVRQTQIEDRCKIEEVLQIEKKTQHLVAESSQSRREDSKAIQDTKSKVEEVTECLESLKQTFEQKVKGQRDYREDEILKKLAKIDMIKDVKRHTDSYVDGTRLAIFAEVESWLDDRCSPNRVMVICGNAGMGKSVISAVMNKKMLEAGRLAGSHFCQHGRARHRNPEVMLQSLASHLAESFLHYRKALVENLSRNLGLEINDMELKDLFELLFEEPLTNVNDPGLTYLILIDGIDESEYQGRNELLDVVADYFKKLPSWIRFLVTTRPEIKIAGRLKCLNPVQLEPSNEENLKDICLFFKKQLRQIFQIENQDLILQALVKKSEGVMLYAHYLADFIKENGPLLTPELLDSILPSGISSVYHSYFKRLEDELRKELKVTEDQFMNFLSAVAVAKEPLALGFVSKLLLSGTCKSTSVLRRKVIEVISCVSALLPVQDGCIHFFHKSVKDWLVEKSNYGQHQFSVEDKEGHRVLSKLCIDELDDVKRKGVDLAHFTDTSKYALLHGVQHMLQLEEDARVCSLADVVKKYCLDLELLYAKLCVSGTAASEDILYVQKQAGASALFEEWQRALGTLLYLLRKHLNTLIERPRAIFQTLLNEGEPELSAEALTLLETRYSEIPYMEFLHKKDLKGRVQTKFHCSAAVICFDVSPQLDYMVCECQGDTIQLWSLHTGKQLWKRHVMVTKDSLSHYSKPLSFYRSVVFHPAEDLVLPGILSHAYTFDGELKALFLLSKCLFAVCSVSADKTKILTDCPDNNKCIVMWNLTDGSEITHFACNEEIVSFASSPDGRLLAISHRFGSISLVDVVDGFKTLAQIKFFEKGGMIKFSPDCQFLFCSVYGMFSRNGHLSCLLVKMDDYGNVSLRISSFSNYYYPWESESCSKTGFLLGDSFWAPVKRGSLGFVWGPELAFVLNEQSVLRVSDFKSVIEMLHPDELTKDRDGCSKTAVRKIVFSSDGDTLYVVTDKNEIPPTTLVAWDISSDKFKAGESVDFGISCLVAVRKGVLLSRGIDILELWNVEMSECMRRWSDVGDIKRVIPLSEERVACEVWNSDEVIVIILDTTSGDIVSTITIRGELVACNSKCQVITTGIEQDELQMQCGKDVLWKLCQPFDVYGSFRCNTFSPNEQYCVVGGQPDSDNEDNIALYVLDAVSGRTLHMLCTPVDRLTSNPDCKFVGDEECVISIKDDSKGYCLKLFNVKSGDLLSEITMESKVYSLAACPRKRLIAIGLEDSEEGFKVLKVKLPRDKDSKTNGSNFKKESVDCWLTYQTNPPTERCSSI